MLNLNNTMIPFLPLFTAAFAVILCSIVPVRSAPLPTFKNLWNPHDPTEGFKKCGREVHGSKPVGFKYGTCACDGLVIYGNNRNGYVNRTVKSGCVPCTNGVFPNRIGGGKQCFCKGSTTRDYYDSSCVDFTKVAKRGEFFNCTGEMRFSAGGHPQDPSVRPSHLTKTATGGPYFCHSKNDDSVGGTAAFPGSNKIGRRWTAYCSCRKAKSEWGPPPTRAPTPPPTRRPSPSPTFAPSLAPTGYNPFIRTGPDIEPGYPRWWKGTKTNYVPITMEWPIANRGECLVSLYQQPYCRGSVTASLGLGTHTVTKDSPVIQAWSKATVRKQTVTGDKTKCYLGLFSKKPCSSVGGVYLMSSSYYDAGGFGANSCGTLQSYFFNPDKKMDTLTGIKGGGNLVHWAMAWRNGSHLGAHGVDLMTSNGDVAYKWVAPYECGMQNSAAESMIISGKGCSVEFHNSTDLNFGKAVIAPGGNQRHSKWQPDACIPLDPAFEFYPLGKRLAPYYNLTASSLSFKVVKGNLVRLGRETPPNHAGGNFANCTCPDGKSYMVQPYRSGGLYPAACLHGTVSAPLGTPADKISMYNTTFIYRTREDPRKGWVGEGASRSLLSFAEMEQKVDCMPPTKPDIDFDRPCRSGDVKLPVNGLDPYIYVAGRWTPICLHYFWDNNNGVKDICTRLGYDGSFASAFIVGANKSRLNGGFGMFIGRQEEYMNMNKGILFGGGQKPRWWNWICAHDFRWLGMKCDGAPPVHGRTASCNEEKPSLPADALAPVASKQACQDGDVMLVGNGSLYSHAKPFDWATGAFNLRAGMGVPYVFVNNSWAPLCTPFIGDFLGTNMCGKLNLGDGSTSSLLTKGLVVPPSLEIGMCKPGEGPLDCTFHEHQRALRVAPFKNRWSENCIKPNRGVITTIRCDVPFSGVAASCSDHAKYPRNTEGDKILQANRQAKMNMEALRKEQCPPKQESHGTAQFPSEILSNKCPNPVMQTTCSTLKGSDPYLRIVNATVRMYETLPTMCNEVCCPQADIAACVLRFAGHDLMDFKPGPDGTSTGGTGGSDGCIDFHDIDNKGLYPCLAGTGEFANNQGITVETVYAQFCDEVSLADFLVIMAEAFMMRTNKAWSAANLVSTAVDFSSQFRFGRKASATCAGNPALPNPENSCNAVKSNFVDSLGLTWEESAALMGVHTLGRASIHNSGYDGWWNAGPEGRDFSNSYYISLIAKGWEPKNMGISKNQWVRSDGGSRHEMMLDTDMCLLFDTPGNTRAAKDDCCAWAGKAKDGLGGVPSQCKHGEAAESNCCAHGDMQGLTCADEFEVGPNIPSAPYMKLFAKNETAWLTTFVKAWKHATENGQEGRLFSTCSATPVVPTTNSELEQASLLNLQ